jgi:hypothetical protein
MTNKPARSDSLKDELGGWPNLIFVQLLSVGCPTLRGFRRVGTMLPSAPVLTPSAPPMPPVSTTISPSKKVLVNRPRKAELTVRDVA